MLNQEQINSLKYIIVGTYVYFGTNLTINIIIQKQYYKIQCFFSLFRDERLSALTIDNGTKMITISTGRLKQLNTNTGLYLGKSCFIQ